MSHFLLIAIKVYYSICKNEAPSNIHSDLIQYKLLTSIQASKGKTNSVHAEGDYYIFFIK